MTNVGWDADIESDHYMIGLIMIIAKMTKNFNNRKCTTPIVTAEERWETNKM